MTGGLRLDDSTRELLKSMEGRDENGEPNVICGIHIFSVGEEPPVEVRGHVCRDGEVSFHIIPGGMSEIMLAFENRTDYEFLQMADVCKEFDERMAEREECLINLTLMNNGDFSEYISAMCRSWAYDVPSPELDYNGIRFFVDTEQIFVVNMPGRMEKRQLDPMGRDYDVEWMG